MAKTAEELKKERELAEALRRAAVHVERGRIREAEGYLRQAGFVRK